MPKDRFVNANPYEELKVSDEERLQLIDLVDGFVTEHFHKLPRPPNLERVKEDLLAAGEQDPTNEEVRRELTVLKKEMKDAREKKKATLDGLFGRGI
ncbi:hypothetical protein PR002_g3888 [Phytophthora rubi]|uniref:Uncharacterized protein n=1 Tax=Phytophthora rubi TaxID=129364 RepID=A0A6A3NFX4_9STRA|nr:hypothetical protein PR002_g3888 [Phytophthora rubi]